MSDQTPRSAFSNSPRFSVGGDDSAANSRAASFKSRSAASRASLDGDDSSSRFSRYQTSPLSATQQPSRVWSFARICSVRGSAISRLLQLRNRVLHLYLKHGFLENIHRYLIDGYTVK